MTFRANEYERYTGERSPYPAWFPLTELTISRGWKSKWVRRITFMSLCLGLGLMVLMYVLNQVVPTWRELTEQIGTLAGQEEDAFIIDAKVYLNLLSLFVYPVLLPLSLLFGYDLISKDIETNAMDSYFSRPISPMNYILGRSLAFIGFLLAATFGPMLLVWIADWATSNDDHFQLIAHVPLAIFASLLLISTALALLVQAVTTLTQSSTWTNFVFIFIFIILPIFSKMLYRMSDEPNMQALSVLHNTWVLCATSVDKLPKWGQMEFADPAISISAMIFIIIFSLIIIYRGLKKRTFIG